MSWTPDQLLKHPQRNSLLGLKTAVAAPAKAAAPSDEIRFVAWITPMGKPRMTQRDRWKNRPVVLRYHEFCDRLREAAPASLRKTSIYAIDIRAFIPMPQSWSAKKKAQHNGCMCAAKPDWDNIGKAVCDAMLKEDSIIADGRCRKYWCNLGDQCLDIRVRVRKKRF